MKSGWLSDTKKNEITHRLGCNGQIPWFGTDSVRMQIRCTFPGHEVYETILALPSLLKKLKNDLEYAKKYLTLLNLKYGYLHKKRTAEVFDNLNQNYLSLNQFRKDFIDACRTMYTPDTALEWLTVYFVPDFDELFNMLNRIKELSSQNSWLPRPLPVVLKQYPDII
jgi:hypothetical protein